MTLDVRRLEALLAAHGAVARVLVVQTKGSAPRAAGTSMVVWADGFEGTIGGGALEWQALETARQVLVGGGARVLRIPLGPALGQCCGGAVTLAVERIEAPPPVPWIRRVEGQSPAPEMAGFAFRDGWLREEATQAPSPVWIWGAGHVGRAVVDVLHPFPDMALTWVDTAAERFPDGPDAVTQLVAADPSLAMTHAPTDAMHVILTYSHELDLNLCHAALARGFRFCGLIGSDTKWARFRTRLAALGHAPDRIARITCPIGDPGLGKHPQAIAVGVVAGLISLRSDDRVPVLRKDAV